jgi:glycosyltransferase involved in cell wall biosynthesis
VSVEPQRAVLVLPSTGVFDSRAWRIAGSLAGRGHRVTVVARSGPDLPDDDETPAGYRVLRVPVSAVEGLPNPLRWIAHRLRGERGAAPADPGSADSGRGVGRPRRAASAAWRLIAIGLTIRAQQRETRRIAPPADLVHAMAYMGIHVGLDLGARDGARVVYDARDIYVEARNIARLPMPLRRLFGRFERRWARQADRVITVNDAYADVMERRLDVTRPLVVMNCSTERDPGAVRPRRFHDVLGLAADRRVVLYHGGLTRDRGIEELLAAIADVSNATLVLMGYGDLQASLEAAAAEPAADGRIAVLPAVPPAELIDWVASADVVAMPIQPTTLNHRLTTPNKLFEAIAAGVPVVASDLPGMAPIVTATGCGVVVDPTSSAAVAAGLRAILDAAPDAAAAFRDGLARARRDYSWDRQMERLLAEYSRLTGRPW